MESGQKLMQCPRKNLIITLPTEPGRRLMGVGFATVNIFRSQFIECIGE